MFASESWFVGVPDARQQPLPFPSGHAVFTCGQIAYESEDPRAFLGPQAMQFTRMEFDRHHFRRIGRFVPNNTRAKRVSRCRVLDKVHSSVVPALAIAHPAVA
jgi:hypothetical protein